MDPQTPYLSPKHFKKYTKSWEHHWEYYFSISQLLGNPKIPNVLTPPVHKLFWGNYGSYFQNFGPKPIGISERFQ